MTIELIEDAIRRARNHESCLDASVLEVPGFSTGVMRRLVSNLCEHAKCYVEVGAYCGGTACAAINNKVGLTAIIFEDFSQSFGRDDVRAQLEQHLMGTAKGPGAYTELVEKNYLMALDHITEPVDIYFYDGLHTYDAQREALPSMLSKLAKKFLFLVDDFNWDDVRRGTDDSIEALKDSVGVRNAWHLRGQKIQDDPIYHNGFAIFACEKL